MRCGWAGALQGTTDRSKLNDFGFDEVYAEARFSGRLTPLFAWQFNLNASYDPLGGAGAAGIMDAIVKFEPMKEFHLWAGRMLVPSDRSNFSGPWFMSPWKYTGADMPIPFVGPRTKAFGRDNGVTAWGDVRRRQGEVLRRRVQPEQCRRSRRCFPGASTSV